MDRYLVVRVDFLMGRLKAVLQDRPHTLHAGRVDGQRLGASLLETLFAMLAQEGLQVRAGLERRRFLVPLEYLRHQLQRRHANLLGPAQVALPGMISPGPMLLHQVVAVRGLGADDVGARMRGDALVSAEDFHRIHRATGVDQLLDVAMGD